MSLLQMVGGVAVAGAVAAGTTAFTASGVTATALSGGVIAGGATTINVNGAGTLASAAFTQPAGTPNQLTGLGVVFTPALDATYTVKAKLAGTGGDANAALWVTCTDGGAHTAYDCDLAAATYFTAVSTVDIAIVVP